MTTPQDAWAKIAPFALRDLGPLLGQDGGTGTQAPKTEILLYDVSAGTVKDYSFSAAGLTGALAASGTGDVVLLPAGTLTLTAGITVPSGVALVGMGDKTFLDMSITATGISLGTASIVAGLKVVLVGTGANVVGINATPFGTLVQHVRLTVSGGSSSNTGILLGQVVTLSVHGSSASITHATAPAWSSVNDPNHWRGAGFRLQTGTALASGTLKVYVTVDSVTVAPNAGLKIMSSNDAANSGVAPAVTPTLSANSSGVLIPTPGDYILTGSGGAAFSTDGYFCITNGWATSGTFSAHLTKIEWWAGTVHALLWDEMVNTTTPLVDNCLVTVTGTSGSAIKVAVGGSGEVQRSTLSGSTYALYNAGTTLSVYGCSYDYAAVTGTITYLAGDRAAWYVTSGSEKHASDINSGNLLRHLPEPSVIGYLAQDAGTTWGSVPPIMAHMGILAMTWDWMGFG